MRILLVLIYFLIGIAFGNAQYVNNSDLRTEAGDYIKAWESQVFMSRARHIQVDFGQDYYLQNRSKSFLRDQLGEKLRFYSPIQVINYFSDLGYAYENICSPNEANECWIFKRKK